VTAARLATTVTRLKERIAGPRRDRGLLRELGGGSRGFLRWINASQGQTVRVITVETSATSRPTAVHARVTARCDSLIRKPIKGALGGARSELVLQIHRSTIVTSNAIAGRGARPRGRTQVRLKRRKELLR